MNAQRSIERQEEFERISALLARTPEVNPFRSIGSEEFASRQKRVWKALQQAGLDAGFVFSNEHYNGDVPYLGGNTNITIEQVGGVIGQHGFHIVAGLEGGYTVEQLSSRAGAPVHKVAALQLAGEDYPIEAERFEDVFTAACGTRPRRIALLTPKDVLPTRMFEMLSQYAGSENLVEASDLYGKIKYEKSDAEVELTRDATIISDAAMRTLLAVLKPGMLETQVAAWANFVIKELGGEELGFDVMVNSNVASRTIIGKALNRRIEPGDMIHLGVSAKRDGLTSCIRRSVVALEPGQSMPATHRYWLDLIFEAYQVCHGQFLRTAEENLPACTIEQAIVDYLAGRNSDVTHRLGRPIDLANQKPYSCVHNAGYTECLEFFGAVTLASKEPLGTQIINMLDVALRGFGSKWDEVVIPSLDYVVVENTYAKSGNKAECLNDLPSDCQELVGRGF